MSKLHPSILIRDSVVNFTVCIPEADLHAFVREFDKQMAFACGGIDKYSAKNNGWILSITIAGADIQQSEKRFHEFLESFFKGRT